MDAAPNYYAPTYFPASYFHAVAAFGGASTPTGLVPYNAPTYFPPSYFYGASSSPDVPAVPKTSGMQPYNAPTYFPPSYFFGASSSDVPAMPKTSGLVPYNAPTYFPPSYFYGASSPPDVPTVPDPSWREHDPYSALLDALRATGEFEDVIFGASTQRGEAGADTYPLAVLTPRGWEESDDHDPTLVVRRVTFSITVAVKGQDLLPRFGELDRLSTAIKEVVDRSDLDGTCVPALTRIRTGRYEYSTHHPEQSIDLEGEFSTIIDPSAGVPAAS